MNEKQTDRLKGRVAIVTGGGRGIGRSECLELAGSSRQSGGETLVEPHRSRRRYLVSLGILGILLGRTAQGAAIIAPLR